MRIHGKRKIFVLVMITITMGLLLVGCGKKKDETIVRNDTLIGIETNEKDQTAKDIYVSYDKKDFGLAVEGIKLDDGIGAVQYFPETDVILYQDNNKVIYMVEKNKPKVKIAQEPTMTIINNVKDIIYTDKDGNLFYKEYEKSVNKIASNVVEARIKDKSGDILYTDKDGKLFLYGNDKKILTVATGVDKFSFTDSKNLLLVTKADENIYTCKLDASGKQELIGESNKYMFLTVDEDNNTYYFKDIEKDGELYYADYYLKKPNEKEIKIISKANCSQYDFQKINNTLYFINKERTLSQVSTSGKDLKEIGKSVKNYVVDDKNNIAFLDSKDVLVVAKKDVPKETISAKDKLYTMVNGKLYLVGMDKILTVDKKEISKDVEEIQISGENLAYYTSKNELYIWDSKKGVTTKILSDVSKYDQIFYGGNIIYINER